MKISIARKAAFNHLLRIERDNAYSTELLNQIDDDLDSRDRHLIHAITMGVLRTKLRLDDEISSLFGKPLTKLDLEILIILRMAAFQFFFMDRIPEYSIVNESVELAKWARKRSAAGLVNAISRKLSKITPEQPEALTIKQAALNTSHPASLLKRWGRFFGEERAVLIAHANNAEPRSAFRHTSGFDQLPQSVRNEITKTLQNTDGVTVSELIPDAWICQRIDPQLRELSENGMIYFQDEASQLAAMFVARNAKGRVLDVCAAPGSKSTQIARELSGDKILVAGELHMKRAKLLKLSALKQRARLSVVCLNAEAELPFEDSAFDTILVDAPCSGTGTIRRNPEIRYRVDESEIMELQEKQLKILDQASKLLKKSGVMVYSTCSLEREENEDVIQKYLALHPGFSLMPLEYGGIETTAEGCLRTYPDVHGTDGFFVACLKRSR